MGMSCWVVFLAGMIHHVGLGNLTSKHEDRTEYTYHNNIISSIIILFFYYYTTLIVIIAGTGLMEDTYYRLVEPSIRLRP
jgi:hypothetical protein